MNTDIELVTKALTDFDSVAAGLEILTKNYAGMLYDVETSIGMEHAKAARAVIREPRYKVERIRKEAKAPLLAIGKKLDAEAARITSELMKLEEPIDQQIKNEEGRKERERLAKIEAEQKRVAGIQALIDAIRGAPTKATGKPSTEVLQLLNTVSSYVIDDGYAEFQETAQSVLEASIAALKGIHAERLNHETEQARIIAERAELDRLRAEQAERERIERERLAEDERKAKAERDAAAAKQAEELRIEREKLEVERAAQATRDAEERAAIEAERKAEQGKIDTENLRLATERAAFERQQEEARRAAAETERQRMAAAEAERKRKEDADRLAKKSKYPGEAAILNALAQHFGVSEEIVRSWLVQLRQAA